ncbi:hypothetical protein G647_04165 [Cladophialophora carrionii CBS 160.54]|uniref:Uncharacterized protein n=1 Tax=Cladophialophora carrionii CBS 160.54 TaxID=1279043 RepID=V9DD62_9EURO|nr:uncharacterized protein G647_04165 [Cladophialophora carrionii CBS 160.54]ETI24795.1 hypothetical protein G647_04165 [Cladophialophora carrionii CBS 160.54]
MPRYSWTSAQPLNDDQISYFAYTIQHAVFLAKQAVMYWPCDPYQDETFLRYFDPTEAEFAKNMFQAVANVPFDLDLTDRAALERLASDPVSFNPRFAGLSIHFLGSHPDLLPENGGPGAPDGGCEDDFDDEVRSAFMELKSGGSVGLLSFCRKVYQYYPMLNDLLYQPDWAIDWQKDQKNGKQYKTGYGGCSDFDYRDNFWMDTTGLDMLHEFFHYPGLFADVPNYAATIPFEWKNAWGETIPHMMLDFIPDLDRDESGGYPSDAYGAWSAMRINQLEPFDVEGVRYRGIYNPDNYAWYATSVFWSRHCGQRFKAPESEEDFQRYRPRPYSPF